MTWGPRGRSLTRTMPASIRSGSGAFHIAPARAPRRRRGLRRLIARFVVLAALATVVAATIIVVVKSPFSSAGRSGHAGPRHAAALHLPPYWTCASRRDAHDHLGQDRAHRRPTCGVQSERRSDGPRSRTAPEPLAGSSAPTAQTPWPTLLGSALWRLVRLDRRQDRNQHRQARATEPAAQTGDAAAWRSRQAASVTRTRCHAREPPIRTHCLEPAATISTRLQLMLIRWPLSALG